MPSIQSLRAFEAACRLGSYTAAAGELKLTHGAISHSIRELEGRCGLPLFQRDGRRMTPTREGVTLLAQVAQALSQLQRAFPARNADGRSVVLSVHPALGSSWLTASLGGLMERHPDLRLELRSTADLEDFLDPGVDLAIRYGGGLWPDAGHERLAGEVLFPVASPAYRDRLGLREPGDLARAQLLRHSWQPWSAWLVAAGLTAAEPERGLVASDGAMLLEAAAAGLGVALTRRLPALRQIEAGALVRLFDIELADTFAYYVLWRAGTVPSPAARLVIDWLGSRMRENL